MSDLKYPDILKLNSQLLEELESAEDYKIKLLSNVTVNQVKELIEFNLRKEGIKAILDFGDYDNIVQDSQDIESNESVLIL